MTADQRSNAQLYFWRLDQSQESTEQAARSLSADEAARADRFVYDRDRVRYINGRSHLRTLLGRWIGTDARNVQFDYGQNGKPVLANGPFFNLSHTNDIACLAIHPEKNLGVDIEHIKPIETGVADRFFSTAEVAELNALPTSQWPQGFFRCWTRKEAVVKQIGEGLSFPLADFSVSLAPSEPALMRHVHPRLGAASDWTLFHLDLGPDTVGAVAIKDADEPMPDIVECPDDLLVSVS